MNPIDDLARLLPPVPHDHDMPGQQRHKAALLTAIAATQQPRPRWRRAAARRGLVPALAALGVAVVALVAVGVPALQSHHQPARPAALPGRPAASASGTTLTSTRRWSVPAASLTAVSVTADVSSVTVRAGATSAAAVTATPRYQGLPPVVTVRVVSGTLTVTEKCPQRRDCQQLQLTVAVPAGVGIKATAVTGSVRVSGVRDAVTATSGQGTIVLSSLSGPVNVSDGQGDVTLTDVSGPVTARSGQGDITATDVMAQRVTLSSQEGSVSAAFSAAPATVTATSQVGDVRLVLPASVTYHVRASTQLGTTSVSVPQSAASSRLINATSQLGTVSVGS